MPAERPMRSLFDELDEPSEALSLEKRQDAPLAERMRPQDIDEVVGQGHLLGPERFLRRALAAGGRLPSIILWGPPGTGKTTIARLLAKRGGATFVAISAVFSGVKELREALAEARGRQGRGGRTVLFVDEIHRFNKSQQDALLAAAEDGTASLVGATTENPSFEINNALLSRCRVLVLEPLGDADLMRLIERALGDVERGLAGLEPRISEALVRELAEASGGDARVALSALEAAVELTPPGPDGRRHVTRPTILEALGRSRFAYDGKSEDHYNLASALIKSVRNSDADAAVYWLARLIEGGADPMFLARRLCILASEDIGLADPQALVQAASAAQVAHLIGLPEALFPLTQAAVYLAQAPKSDAIKRAYREAATDAAATATEPVPLQLRNAVTGLMRTMGYGAGYRSIHDDPQARQEMPCLPERLRGRRYVDPNPGRAAIASSNEDVQPAVDHAGLPE